VRVFVEKPKSRAFTEQQEKAVVRRALRRASHSSGDLAFCAQAIQRVERSMAGVASARMNIHDPV